MSNERIEASEAARRLGITLRTLWRWRDAGKIKEAGRAGRTVMFYAADVDRLRGVDVAEDVNLADVYIRLTEVDTWEDVDLIKDAIAATLCRHATGEALEALEKSYRAALGMAATHPREDARDRWARTARQYGRWLGRTTEETDAAIEHRARAGSFSTYEAALAEAEAAPFDPAYTVAALSKRANSL